MRLPKLEDALAVGEVRGLALAETELLEVAAAGGLVVQGVEEVDADRVRDGGRPGPLPSPGGAAPRQPRVQVVPLAVAQPVVITVVVRLAVEGRGVAVIVVDELEVVEAVADALRAEVSEQLQPHAALHHAGGVAGALALAAGLGADGDGLDAGGVLSDAVVVGAVVVSGAVAVLLAARLALLGLEVAVLAVGVARQLAHRVRGLARPLRVTLALLHTQLGLADVASLAVLVHAALGVVTHVILAGAAARGLAPTIVPAALA